MVNLVVIALGIGAVGLAAAPLAPRPGEKNPLAGDPAAIAAGDGVLHPQTSAPPSRATPRGS